MSSAITLRFETPIPLAAWQIFCTTHDITYSPHTVGGNYYYQDDIEIQFGESDLHTENATPPSSAEIITVSTYYLGNLQGVATMAKTIIAQWPGSFECDSELEHYILGA